MAATTTHHEEERRQTHESCGWPAFENVERTVQTARRVVTDARQATEAFAEGTAEKVRRHPLAAVGLAAVGGLVVGGLAGVAYGVLTGRRP
jgi:ElaB/YqjD/DUF883 family membrane-anchored ribosome-binding protein